MLGAVGDVTARALGRNACVLTHACVHLCWSREGTLRLRERCSHDVLWKMGLEAEA